MRCCCLIDNASPATFECRKMSESKPPAAWLAIKPYVNGGASGMAATCIIQPIDMVKVRLQLGAKGSPVSETTEVRGFCRLVW